jgi:hypothetical protein
MDTLTDELRALEERLLDPQVRRDRLWIASLLAPEFVEFGSSGRIFTRNAILDLLESETACRTELADFRTQHPAPGSGHRFGNVEIDPEPRRSEPGSVCPPQLPLGAPRRTLADHLPSGHANRGGVNAPYARSTFRAADGSRKR